jgi:ABC transport system ATP-binding/permease protein
VRLLSGGERRRLQLALVLREGPNVLLLDEPTNDLDLDTLRALEDMLDAWPGTLVVVSHDRAFLERTVEDVLVMDGHEGRPGHAARLPGGFAAYVAARREARRPGWAGPASTRSPAGSPRPATGRTRAPAGERRRSPSTLRHLLRKAEAELARLAERQAELEAELAAAGGDHVALAEVGERLSTVTADLATAEETWLALAEEAETAGAPPSQDGSEG